MARDSSLYKQISARIVKDYGSLLGGEALPGERALAEKYSVKRSTVQYALKKLSEQGVVDRLRGSGTFMHKDSMPVLNITDAELKGTKGISALVRSYGVQVRNEVLVEGTITGNRFLESKLGLEEDEPVFALHRVRYGNKEPFAIEYSYVPKKLFEDIETVDFRKVSLYEYMEAKGHLPDKYDKKIRMIKLFPKEARYLEMPVDGPAFSFELIGVDEERRPVEYTESYLRCDKVEFRFSVRI